MKLRIIKNNMTVITTNNGLAILFSYETPVAVAVPGKGYFKTDRRWSQTTTSHINKWLCGIPAESIPQSEIERIANG